MYGDEGAWHALMDKFTRASIDYLTLQIDAGVQAIQVFDSWIGCLGVSEFNRFVAPHSQALFEAIVGQVPVIHFGTGNPALSAPMSESGGDVLALDWRSDLVAVWDETGAKAVQGNLDPIVLCASREAVVQEADHLLSAVGSRPGHIFNLGHGIIPETPVDNVKALVDFVHERSAQIRGSS